MRSRGALLVTFLLFGAALSFLPVSVVHAFTNGVDSQASFYDSAFGHVNPCIAIATCTLINPLSAGVQHGDLLVLFTSCNPSGSTITGVTDGQGDTWVLGKAATQATQNASIFSLRVEGWYSLSANPSGGSIGNVVISFSGTVTTCNLWIGSVNIATTTLAASDGQTKITVGTGGTGTLTSAAFNSPSNTYYVAFDGALAKSASQVSCSGTFTPTSPLVAESSSNNCNPAQVGNYLSGTGLSNAVAASGTADTYQTGFFSNTLQLIQTAYNTGTDHTSFAAVFLRFGPSVTLVNPVVTACTFVQLQCWWYPSFFLLAFSGVAMLVAGVSKTSPKAAMYLFLSALTFGSFVAVIFGIMNIVLPLVLVIVNVIYGLRSRG